MIQTEMEVHEVRQSMLYLLTKALTSHFLSSSSQDTPAIALSVYMRSKWSGLDHIGDRSFPDMNTDGDISCTLLSAATAQALLIYIILNWIELFAVSTYSINPHMLSNIMDSLIVHSSLLIN